MENDHIFLGTNYTNEDDLPEEPIESYRVGYDDGWSDRVYWRGEGSSSKAKGIKRI